MHNSDLIRDFDAHKASFDEYRHAVQTVRTLKKQTMEEQEEWLKTTANGGAMEDTALAPFPSGSLWEDFTIDAVQSCHGRRSSLPCRGTSALGQQQWVVKSLVLFFWHRHSFHSAKA
jgi:hypothetical protein